MLVWEINTEDSRETGGEDKSLVPHLLSRKQANRKRWATRRLPMWFRACPRCKSTAGTATKSHRNRSRRHPVTSRHPFFYQEFQSDNRFHFLSTFLSFFSPNFWKLEIRREKKHSTRPSQYQLKFKKWSKCQWGRTTLDGYRCKSECVKITLCCIEIWIYIIHSNMYHGAIFTRKTISL